MTGPVWLIAGREFRAYAMTSSFWIALVMGPLLMTLALVVTAAAPRGPSQTAVLTLTREPSGNVVADFGRGFPLSPAGRVQVLQVLEADSALHAPVRLASSDPKPKLDSEALRRFAVLMMLWMTLAGSLGMLLQAVVRERSNRALESLLAAATPSAIVFGKLIGVGGVSLLVMTAWLASSAGLGVIAPASGGAVASLLQGFAEPAMLARAGGIYLLAFTFYGLTTVAVGALARDNADAQNLARPMFAVLLTVFFTAMASAFGAHGLGWLAYLPPFTPFMLLIQPRPLVAELPALATLAAGCAFAGWIAVRTLRLSPATAIFQIQWGSSKPA